MSPSHSVGALCRRGANSWQGDHQQGLEAITRSGTLPGSRCHARAGWLFSNSVINSRLSICRSGRRLLRFRLSSRRREAARSQLWCIGLWLVSRWRKCPGRVDCDIGNFPGSPMYPPSATPVFLFCPSYIHGWLVDSKSRCESRAIIIKGTDLFDQGDCSTVRRSISLLPAIERLAISSSMPIRDPRSSVLDLLGICRRKPVASRSRSTT